MALFPRARGSQSGSLGSVRDFSPAAEKLFQSQVPGDLVQALHQHPGNWKEVFGADADETFSAYAVAHYINQIAVAGKAEYPLPLYVNNWLKYRPDAIPGVNYPSGGPTYNMIDVWKAAAPAIDMIGPDIYMDDSDAYREVLNAYRRPDNPLWVPETGGSDADAKYFFMHWARARSDFRRSELITPAGPSLTRNLRQCMPRIMR